MAGIIDKVQSNSQQQPASTQASPPAKSGAVGNPSDPFEKVSDDPEMQEAVDRVVAAGGKIIYSDEGGATITEGLQAGASDPAQAVAKETFTLMLSLDEKSKGTIPEEAIIPAGMKLLTLVAELGETSGAITVDPNTVPQAMQHLVAMAIEAGIIDPAAIEEMIASMDPADVEAMVAEQDQIANAGQAQAPEAAMAGGAA